MNTAATTLRSGARIDPLSISFPVAITIGWIVALLIAPEMGALAYAAPFLGASMCLALWCLYRSRDRRRLTTIILLVVATSVLSLAFRQRELGETGLDWQNGAKLAVWCAIIGMGALRWRDLIGFLRKPLTGLSFAFAVIALLSATWSEVPAYTAASAFGLVAYLILACLAGCATSTRLPPSRRFCRALQFISWRGFWQASSDSTSRGSHHLQTRRSAGFKVCPATPTPLASRLRSSSP